MTQKFAYIKKKYYFCAQFQNTIKFMAKQSGLYKIRGKVEGRSYYKPKDSKNFLSRSINQQMSERVKTEENYETTRNHAAEFGACSMNAGSALSMLIERNIIMTKSARPAFLCKRFLDLLSFDSIAPLGRRGWSNMSWQDTMRSQLDSLSKVPASRYYNTQWSVGVSDGTRSGFPVWNFVTTCKNTSFDDAALKGLGIDVVRYEFYLASLQTSEFDSTLGQYSRAIGNSQIIGSFRHNVGEPYPPDGIEGFTQRIGYTEDENGAMVYPFVICKAYKLRGSSEVEIVSLGAYVHLPIIDNTIGIKSLRYNGHTYTEDVEGPVVEISVNRTLSLQLQNLSVSSRDYIRVLCNGVTSTSAIPLGNEILVTYDPSLDGEQLSVVSLIVNSTTYTLQFIN